MLKIKNLPYILRNFHVKFLWFLLAISIHYTTNGQRLAWVNNGCNVYVKGAGTLTSKPSISLHGSYLNRNDGVNDGKIELNSGVIWLDSNWTNDANNNVFTNITGNKQDGIVTFENPRSIQFIDGNQPTHFENIHFKDYRKQLLNNNNQIFGQMFLDAVLVLNTQTFIIDNNNPLAINYKSGFIKSETFPGNYGIIQWNIGNGNGLYKIPFGSDNTSFNDLKLIMDITTPMNIGDNISFSTYHADIYNDPLPTGASPLELEPMKVVDRYWIIKPSNPLSKPTSNITFTYSGQDVAQGLNNINPKYLKASRNNTDIGKWLDMEPRGTSANNTVTINNVTPTEFYAPWTLVNVPGPLANVFIPDAFTPNNDGLNDFFKPTFQINFEVISYEFYIFDRWGNVQFYSQDQNEGWNGKKNNIEGDPLVGVYTWMLVVRGSNSELNSTEYRDKLTGKVTLLK